MTSRWFFFFLGVALVQTAFSLNPIAAPEEEWDDFEKLLRDPAYRLPTTTRPRHYEVELTPYFEVVPVPNRETFTFDGQVAIYLSPTVEGISEIVMHCNDLTILDVKIERVVNNIVTDIADAAPEGYVCDPIYDFLRINTSENLEINQEYVARISFIGNLQSNMRGFYRSWYYDSTGKRWMGTTQFQPGHARQAFPCYDEPGFKATFDITINRQEDFSPTISNMPIRSSTGPINGVISETFYTTPVTSTYLLAFIVSHYDKVATNNDAQRPFDIYARDNAGSTGEWSLEIGELLLDEMERFTDIPYYTMAENINMKQAAIPDFSAGAMENWGLLTYREALILYDPDNSNHFYKQRVANIVSHEITHMWFGNLVTCAWWDNLWLNEGFARLYQYYLTEKVAPELGFGTRFIVEQLQTAMVSDSVDTAHALTDLSVGSPTTVSSHFSTITYARGAAVIRMTQHLLGEETYQKGIRYYLKERQFDVAEPHHLFSALDQAAAEDNALAIYNGITINEYFRTWSEKAGHPLVTVVIDQSTGRMIITQERWERTTGVSQHQGLWHIPITWTRGGAPDFENLKPSQFVTAQASFIDRGTTGNEWVIFNKQESGFYRVNYDPTNWALITRALRSSEREIIHEYNRAQIVDDVLSLARGTVMSYQRAFNIISFLEFEDAYAPWIAAINDLPFVIRRLAHQPDNLQKLQNVIINLSTAVVNRLGFRDIAGEPYMDGLLRMYLMTFLCDNGHPQCISEGRTNFQNWRNGVFIPANMRPWVYCVGLREGTADDFDYFWNRYIAEDLASEKVVMLQVAGCTSDQASLEKYLNAISAGDEDIRSQDYSVAINSALSGNEINTLRVFQWLQNNVQRMSETAGLATIINGIGGRLLNEQDISTFENWLEDNSVQLGSAYNTGVNAVATARSNLEWSDRRVSEMEAFFETGYTDDDIDEITDGGEEEVDGGEDVDGEEADGDDNDNDDGSANIAALSVVTLIVTLLIHFNI